MDFPILAFQHVAKITDLSIFGGGVSLDIKGRDFTDLSAVLVNGYKSPTFVVLSDTRVLADIPATQIGVPIRTLTVLRSTARNSEDSVVSFESIVPTTRVSGQTYLVQRVLKTLLTTPGRDIFRPESGAGLLSLLGPMPIDSAAAYGLVSLRVQTSVARLIADQVDDPSLPLDQKLSAVEVQSAEYSTADTSLDVRLRIIAANGSSVVAGVVL
jgi:hypothetical protein